MPTIRFVSVRLKEPPEEPSTASLAEGRSRARPSPNGSNKFEEEHVHEAIPKFII
jgi:hypothetical protein